MRLLAFSDIHHNLVAVRKLRASERNSFDAIVVAGDIGSKSAIEFFKILSTFNCPVLCIFGNWDHELGYRTSYGDNCHLIHSNVVTVGDIHFTGFSGCPTNWGKNPIARKILGEIKLANKRVVDAYSQVERSHRRLVEIGGSEAANKALKRIRNTEAYQKYISQLRAARDSILKLNRESVGKAVRSSSIDPRKCVVITHQRLTRLSEELPGTLLHLFGHIHQYSDQLYKGTRHINVAALDRPAPARPRAKKRWAMKDCRNVNAGNYVKIEIGSSQEISSRCAYLRREYPNWQLLEDSRFLGTDWISEEMKWAHSPGVRVKLSDEQYQRDIQ
jgi:Icc-related predicted phosphoesterase